MSAAYQDFDVSKLVSEAIEADNGPVLGASIAKPIATKAIIAKSENPEEADANSPQESPEAVEVDEEGVQETPEQSGEAGGDVPESDEPDDVEADVPAETGDQSSEPPELPAEAGAEAFEGADVELAETREPADLHDPEPASVADVEVDGPEEFELSAPETTDVPESEQPEIFDVDVMENEPEVWAFPDELKQIQDPAARDSFQADFGDVLGGQAPIVGDRSGGY